MKKKTKVKGDLALNKNNHKFYSNKIKHSSNNKISLIQKFLY